jgi:hypothetical protein
MTPFSLADMLDAAAIDGVLIAAPTDQHSALIAQVTAAGLPMLCEKPCGLTAEAARASADAVRRAKVPLPSDGATPEDAMAALATAERLAAAVAPFCSRAERTVG